MSSVASTASHAVDHVKDAASIARWNVVDLGIQIVKLLNTIRSQEMCAVDSGLHFIGLQRRESALRPVLIFAAGAVVGSSLAIFLTPTSGKDLRAKLLAFLATAKTVEEQSAEQRPDAAAGSKVTDVAKPPEGPRVSTLS